MEQIDLSSTNNVFSAVRVKAEISPGRLNLVYSQPGAGKTSTFCQAKNVLLFECGDPSGDVLKESGAIPENVPIITAKNFTESKNILEQLGTQDHPYKSIVVDGAGGLDAFCTEYVFKEQFEGSNEAFNAYGKGKASCDREWASLVPLFSDIRARGIWVWLLAHKATITERNPAGDDYIKNAPALGKDHLLPFAKIMDSILFIDFIISNAKEGKLQLGEKAKMIGGEARMMYVMPSASYEAKNRLGLTEPIPMGDSPVQAFTNISAAIKAAKQKRTKA